MASSSATSLEVSSQHGPSIISNRPIGSLPLISLAFLIGVSLYILYSWTSSHSTRPTQIATDSVDLEKAVVKLGIATPTRAPSTPRNRSPPSYVSLPLEEQEERLRVKSRLTTFRFPPPQAPPPFGPLPSIPRTALPNASDPIYDFDYLYEEPAYPDSPTIPPGLFQEDSLPSAY